ncbi:MmgE/PrpD family protein [Cloacibacillus evryensis]
MKEYLNKHSEQLYEYVLNERYSKAPRHIQAMLKRIVLDTFGAIIAGTEAPVSHITRDVVNAQYTPGRCTVIGQKDKLAIVGAAFANGASANALDCDDGNRPTKGHCSASVLPAVFALAEEMQLSGERFLDALLVAYEIGIRASVLAHKLRPDYHSTGSWSGLGIVAGHCNIKKYDIETFFHALGIAEGWGAYSPMMRGVDYPNMLKDAISWGSMSGTVSALMAEKGHTGIPPLFTFKEAEPEIDTLGKKYRAEQNYFKPFCACRWTHAGAYAAKDLIDKCHCDVNDIAEIKICSFEEAIRLPYSEPSNTENAQYNIGFPIASYLVYGQVGPRQVLNEFRNEKILSLMSKMKVEHDPELQALFPTTSKTRLEITMNDGTVYKSEAMQPEGDYNYRPFDDDSIKEKYTRFVTPVLGESKTEAFYENVMNIEKFSKAADILTGLDLIN